MHVDAPQELQEACFKYAKEALAKEKVRSPAKRKLSQMQINSCPVNQCSRLLTQLCY